MHPEQTLLARYLGYLLIEFGQIFTTNGLWGNDECIKFWGQKVKVMVGSNMLGNVLIVQNFKCQLHATCWWRHNSWRQLFSCLCVCLSI